MVCNRCDQAMTTREERGYLIPATTVYTYRRLISECGQCEDARVVIGLDESKREASVRKAWENIQRRALARSLRKARDGMTVAMRAHRKAQRAQMATILGEK